MLKLRNQAKISDSDSSESSSESEESIEETPKKTNGTLVINKNPIIDKLTKLEGYLVKFNGLQNLIDPFQKNVKLLEGLKLKNLDQLKELERLKVLDGVASGLNQLKNLELLKNLEALNELDKLEKLDIFNDERINQLFIGVDMIKDKLTSFKSDINEGPLSKVGEINSKLDIITLSLKPFRESGVINKLLDIPNRITEIKDNFKVPAELLNIPAKLSEIIAKSAGTSGLQESLNSILKNSAQLSDLSLIESTLIKKTDDLKLYLDQRLNQLQDSFGSSNTSVLDIVDKIITSNGEFSTKLETELRQIEATASDNLIQVPEKIDNIFGTRLLEVAEDIKNEIIKEILQIKNEPGTFDKIEHLAEIKDALNRLDVKIKQSELETVPKTVPEHPEDILNGIGSLDETIKACRVEILSEINNLRESHNNLTDRLKVIGSEEGNNTDSTEEILDKLNKYEEILSSKYEELINKQNEISNTLKSNKQDEREFLGTVLSTINLNNNITLNNLSEIKGKVNQGELLDKLKLIEDNYLNLNQVELLDKLNSIEDKFTSNSLNLNQVELLDKLKLIENKLSDNVNQVELLGKLNLIEDKLSTNLNQEELLNKLKLIEDKLTDDVTNLNQAELLNKLKLIEDKLSTNLNQEELLDKLNSIGDKLSTNLNQEELLDKLNSIEDRLSTNLDQRELLNKLILIENKLSDNVTNLNQVEILDKLSLIEDKLSDNISNLNQEEMLDKLCTNFNQKEILNKLNLIEDKLITNLNQGGLLDKLGSDVPNFNQKELLDKLSILENKLDLIGDTSIPNLNQEKLLDKLSTNFNQKELLNNLKLIEDKLGPNLVQEEILSKLSRLEDKLGSGYHNQEELLKNLSCFDNGDKLDKLERKLLNIENKLSNFEENKNKILIPHSSTDNVSIKLASLEMSQKHLQETLTKIETKFDSKDISSGIIKSKNSVENYILSRHNELVTKLGKLEQQIPKIENIVYDLSNNFSTWANSLAKILNDVINKGNV